MILFSLSLFKINKYFIQVVEENLQSLLHEERIPVHSEMISIEALDIRESSSEGIQMVNEKSEPQHQVGQNFETVRIIFLIQ